MAELTIPMAYNIVKYCDIKDNETILDFGCAMGYMVKALKLLGFNIRGCDISKYAISQCDRDVEDLLHNTLVTADWCISKDVFEHLTTSEIEEHLEKFQSYFKNIFLVIPLGDGNKFVVPEYEHDITHITKQTKEWWEEKFKQYGWKIEKFNYTVNGVKDNWNHYEKGNGFWILKNEY